MPQLFAVLIKQLMAPFWQQRTLKKDAIDAFLANWSRSFSL